MRHVQKNAKCAGHYSHVQLALPVFHIRFFWHTIRVLQCVCKTYGQVLLSKCARRHALRRARNPRGDAVSCKVAFGKVLEQCKKANTFLHCYALNSNVKRVMGLPTLKIVHK